MTLRRKKTLFALGASALAGGVSFGIVRRMRRDPSAYSYRGRWLFEVPRPFLTRPELFEILSPKEGEDILEVGPGTGYYSLDVARSVLPGGTLAILDVQREMLDHTARRAEAEGLQNLAPTLADAARMPYPDDSFDAAYLVAVLGEVPDEDGAFGELRRVVRPGGRVVVGEAVTDPHRLSRQELRRRAEGAGLRFERESGGILGYFARFGA